MFCTKCGTVIAGRGAFCSACGAPSSDGGAAGEAADRDARLPEDVPRGDVSSAHTTAEERNVSAYAGKSSDARLNGAPFAAAKRQGEGSRVAPQGNHLIPLLVGLIFGIISAAIALALWSNNRKSIEAVGDKDHPLDERAGTSQPAVNAKNSLTGNSNIRTEPPESSRAIGSPGGAGTPSDAYNKPVMVSRADWGARAPLAEMIIHSPTRITICHTATPQQPLVTIEEKMRKLQSFSQRPDKLATGQLKPAWPDVPYHFYVSADGRIAEGRGIRYAGDTNTDYDPKGHILIVLEGNFEMEHPTPEQLDSLYRLTAWLVHSLGIPASEIRGHKEYAPTACPGKNMIEELARIRQRLGGR
jgi:N-acetylmuramoyl-L-alanine amidase